MHHISCVVPKLVVLPVSHPAFLMCRPCCLTYVGLSCHTDSNGMAFAPSSVSWNAMWLLACLHLLQSLMRLYVLTCRTGWFASASHRQAACSAGWRCLSCILPHCTGGIMRDCTAVQHPWTEISSLWQQPLACCHQNSTTCVVRRRVSALNLLAVNQFSAVNVRSPGLTFGRVLQHACRFHMQDSACLLHPVQDSSILQ